MRIRPGSDSTKETSGSRFDEECPTMISRDSSAECSSSGKIFARGLLNTETASAKFTRCFRKLDRALRGSYSNTKDIASNYFREISSEGGFFGWDAGIRTPIRSSRGCSLTVRRRPNFALF
jgi:hypothetical protein